MKIAHLSDIQIRNFKRHGKNFKYKVWSRAVKEKDKYCCRRYFLKIESKKIHAHHIRSWQKYVDLRFDINNGVSLCFNCRKVVHKNKEKGFIIL